MLFFCGAKLLIPWFENPFNNKKNNNSSTTQQNQPNINIQPTLANNNQNNQNFGPQPKYGYTTRVVIIIASLVIFIAESVLIWLYQEKIIKMLQDDFADKEKFIQIGVIIAVAVILLLSIFIPLILKIAFLVPIFAFSCYFLFKFIQYLQASLIAQVQDNLIVNCGEKNKEKILILLILLLLSLVCMSDINILFNVVIFLALIAVYILARYRTQDRPILRSSVCFSLSILLLGLATIVCICLVLDKMIYWIVGSRFLSILIVIFAIGILGLFLIDYKNRITNEIKALYKDDGAFGASQLVDHL